jgi:peptidoglycan/LPS O-acetylase OafA/YrhL
MAVTAPRRVLDVGVAGGRRFELDWLRAFVVLGLIPYHAAVVFALGPGDYVKSTQRALGFDLAATVVSFFGMPLLFLVSGAATWFALGRRSPGRYVAERVGRLAIPFVVGVFALVPIQLYFGRRATPGYDLSYPQFYWGFLVDWAHITEHSVFGLGFQYWGHLWFLLYLLAVSVFLLPLLEALRGAWARHVIAWLASRCRGIFGLALLGAPFAVVLVTLRGPIGPLPVADYISIYSGAAGLVLFAAAFVVGYVLFADARFPETLVRARVPSLLLALVLLALHEIALAILGQRLTGTSWGAFAILAVRGYITWFGLVAILGFARRYLAVDTAALRYLNEAAFPIYVLHMPILTALAFYIVRWDAPILAQFALVIAGTAVVTFAVYEIIVRRFRLTRFLFGLKPRRAAGAI